MDEMSLNNDVTKAGGERALLAGRYSVVKQLGHGGMGSVWRKAREEAERKEEDARKAYKAKEATSDALIIKTGNYSITDGKVTLGKGLFDQAIPTSTESDFVIPRTIKGYPVTSIGKRAFSECSALTSVTIPDGVTSIGDEAFFGCDRLTSVTIPDSVTSIGREAFYGCSRLTSVTIPDSVTSIGWGAFYGCSRLKSVTIPDSVTSIGRRAFYGCSRLASVSMPLGYRKKTKIGAYAFPKGCRLIERDR